MDKIGKQQNENDTRQAKKLSNEIVGRFLQNLSVGNRLKSERVSPLWKRVLQKWGPTELRKLDWDVVFEGVNEEEIDRFWETLDDGDCHLSSLIHRCSPWLRELDLYSFGEGNIVQFLQQIVESFKSLKNLEKLDIRGLRLHYFLDHLPLTLLDLKTSGWINIEILQLLSNRCPNLEEVPFENLKENNLKTETLIELIRKFPRQKKLDLHYFPLPSEKQGTLISIGQLKALKELDLWKCVSLDGHSLEAIVQGCQHLRSLTCNIRLLTEGELFQLAKFPNLKVLQVDDRYGRGTFSDAVLKAIAARGQLKKLYVIGPNSENSSLTDASIVYLVDRCKSLVSLAVYYCPQITERSLEAVAAEVRCRHATAQKTLPCGHLDPGIFYFDPFLTGIDRKRARQLFKRNPWLRFGDVDYREIIYSY